jgi:hypothetical protein
MPTPIPVQAIEKLHAQELSQTPVVVQVAGSGPQDALFGSQTWPDGHAQGEVAPLTLLSVKMIAGALPPIGPTGQGRPIKLRLFDSSVMVSVSGDGALVVPLAMAVRT